jgi:hypothetical protein
MPAKPEPQISPKLLSSLFARFTADRDALLAAVERCELRLVELSERLGAPGAGGEAAGADGKADHALAVAKEALEIAREAMAAVRQQRG